MRDTKQDVLHFWFEETDPSIWFQKNDSFDVAIRDRFAVTYDMAKEGLCHNWDIDADGVLALCLVLDQFPRRLFRGTAAAYETDASALLMAKRGISKGFDMLLAPERRFFLYMPFEHSENMADQKRNVELFKTMKDVNPLAYNVALRKLEIIEKFNRFPERNKALGRISTTEELEYLKERGRFND